MSYNAKFSLLVIAPVFINICLGETQTPSETNCQREYADAATYLRNHPNIQDGPDFPTCDQDGTYASKQCNEFTDVCWCVDTTDGVMVEGTLTDPDEGYLLDCSRKFVFCS